MRILQPVTGGDDIKEEEMMSVMMYLSSNFHSTKSPFLSEILNVLYCTLDCHYYNGICIIIVCFCLYDLAQVEIISVWTESGRCDNVALADDGFMNCLSFLTPTLTLVT